MKFTHNNELSEAPISFAIVAIPSEPLYSAVAKASMAITERCKNNNIIDNETFPCHISLLISGGNEVVLQEISKDLKDKRFKAKNELMATSIFKGGRGFIGLQVEGQFIWQLHRAILSLVQKALHDKFLIRHHLIPRWARLSDAERTQIRRYGSYHVAGNFDPHFSIAQVEDTNLDQMAELAVQHIKTPQKFSISQLQIVIVGHENERWDVFFENDII